MAVKLNPSASMPSNALPIRNCTKHSFVGTGYYDNRNLGQVERKVERLRRKPATM